MSQSNNRVGPFPPKSADESTARYFIARYVRDPFRREPRNVGVVVQKAGRVIARFFAELPDTGAIDGGALKSFGSPKAYRMWVSHWRKTIARHPDDWDARLLSEGGANYSMIPGGEVTNTGGDDACDVCSYLYGMLVSEGGLREDAGSC